jgi:hypothetical protein
MERKGEANTCEICCGIALGEVPKIVLGKLTTGACEVCCGIALSEVSKIILGQLTAIEVPRAMSCTCVARNTSRLPNDNIPHDINSIQEYKCTHPST